mmetsp:Transcript_38183/g.110269  ORF Transcript_38183/g.110269 Transcript_38183/m.110269 type:complete len:207 (-) Transcript_38183:717-1337(-)
MTGGVHPGGGDLVSGIQVQWPAHALAFHRSMSWAHKIVPARTSKATTRPSQWSPISFPCWHSAGSPGLAPRNAMTADFPPGPAVQSAGGVLASSSNSCSQIRPPSLRPYARTAPFPPKGAFQALLPLRLDATTTVSPATTAPPVLMEPSSPFTCHLGLPSFAARQSTAPEEAMHTTKPSAMEGASIKLGIGILIDHLVRPVAGSMP